MQKILISIIIPVYRVPELYLRKCIDSVTSQTLSEIEILLVDDGSPDQCGEICDSYANRDQRVKVIHKKNGGLSSARNAGFLAASGEWIMYVDGDDWIAPEMCQTMYDVAKRNNVQLVMCGMVKDYGHSSTKYKYYLEEDKLYNAKECNWLQQQLLIYNGNIAVVPSKLIKREFLKAYNILHDEVLKQGAEGLEFNIRLFEKLETAIFINKPFYHYTYNGISISASHNEENHKYVINCFEKIEVIIQESANREQLMSWFYNRLLYVIITTTISGYFNPLNTEPYQDKKRKFKVYLEQAIIQRALVSENRKGLSKQRLIILWMIESHLFFLLNIMGKIRKWQKDNM